eukprot:CAMPEP_0185597710 /NCGR_PEP_ID=MMETSP0434-20130131/81543_1 /TAXON_ID=626734 ORGANISM="Favella taraikaensis, Strain Fe Narragansett Bay" /NCGR_SAMPLE_ID=MMETSP0434 /ASSEMBLY_ACC=CAM_ASM_000379 /LENGTH=118 /DNA_ID=CAMNT_0028226515 /DNA_START=786 /DNA_END=1142 /DNA_ORIENTATION=-
MVDVESENISSDSDLNLAENKASNYYDNACDDYQNTEVERTNNLKNINKIITRLLKKGNVAMGTQTEPCEGLPELQSLAQAKGEKGSEPELRGDMAHNMNAEGVQETLPSSSPHHKMP